MIHDVLLWRHDVMRVADVLCVTRSNDWHALGSRHLQHPPGSNWAVTTLDCMQRMLDQAQMKFVPASVQSSEACQLNCECQ